MRQQEDLRRIYTKKNLETIIEKIRNKNKDAVIILRTPTPMWNTGSREANIPQYIAKMKQVADEQNLIYIDQYTELQKAFNDYGWLKKILFYSEIICIRAQTDTFL